MIKLTKRNAQILLILSIILVFLGFQEPQLKQAVADVEGRTCVTNKECPCFGEIEGTGIKSFGIGTSTCREDVKTCDTSFCIDVAPVGTYLRNNPLQWAKNNIMMVVGIIGLLAVLALWPRQ